MDVTFCPLAPQWGSVSEFVAALGSLVIGYFLIKISQRANSTSEKLKELEDKRDEAASELKVKETRLLLVSLAHPLLDSYVSIHSLAVSMTKIGQDRLAVDKEVQAVFLKMFKGSVFEVPDGVRSRMHFVDSKTAARFLHIEAAIKMFVRAAENLASGLLLPAVANDSVRDILGGLPRLEGELGELFEVCRREVELAGITMKSPEFRPMSGDAEALLIPKNKPA